MNIDKKMFLDDEDILRLREAEIDLMPLMDEFSADRRRYYRLLDKITGEKNTYGLHVVMSDGEVFFEYRRRPGQRVQ